MSATHQTSAVSPWQRLFALLRTERTDLSIAIIFSLAIGLLSLAVPVATQGLVNTIAFGNLRQPLLILSLVLLAVLLVSAILQVFRFRVVERLQQRIFVRIASESVNRLLRARTDILQLQNGPEIVNRFLDIVIVQKAGSTLLVDGLSVAMQTVVGMALLAVYHPWLLAFDAVLLVVLVIVMFPFGVGAVSTAVKESKAKYALVAWLEEIARNPTTFRGAAQSRWAFHRADGLTNHYLDYRSSHFKILLRQFGGALSIQAIASAALLGLGGMLVIDRQLTLGQLVASELVVTAVVSGISKLAKHLETFYDLMASLDKLGSLTDLPVEQSGSDSPTSPNSPMGLRVKGPRFVMEVAPGEKIGLTGVSGTGKSTLLDAICGYGESAYWTVEADGIDLRGLDLPQFRSQVSLVRRNEIFHGSVLDNIRVGREDVSMADAQRALNQVGIWETIQALPKGIHSMLATGGTPLSEGAQQALMVARALAGEPRLLLLDESLDSVQDTAERELLTNLLFDERAPWTLILVSSREDLLQRCQRRVSLSRNDLQEAA